MSFGKRFKALRLETGCTQTELMLKFNRKYGYNFGNSAMSQYEHDKRYPELDVLAKWCEFFGVTMDYLYGGGVMYETRKRKIIKGKSGSGSESYRISIPSRWARNLINDGENTEIIMVYNDEENTIKIKTVVKSV